VPTRVNKMVCGVAGIGKPTGATLGLALRGIPAGAALDVVGVVGA
jgi:hypothetical protein